MAGAFSAQDNLGYRCSLRQQPQKKPIQRWRLIYPVGLVT
ncbi:hypothetical protein O982_15565 [Mycobacterium avium 10-5581]|nr:hypothetical protein O982_15565 [Mycobacterium avium 10-5581]